MGLQDTDRIDTIIRVGGTTGSSRVVAMAIDPRWGEPPQTPESPQGTMDGSAAPPERLLLLINDTGTITDPAERLQKLRAKLTTYAEYIGEERYTWIEPVRKDLVGVRPESASIEVVCDRPPTDEMIAIQSIEAKRGDGVALAIPVLFRLQVRTKKEEALVRFIESDPFSELRNAEEPDGKKPA
jgi:hypothetical protein